MPGHAAARALCALWTIGILCAACGHDTPPAATNDHSGVPRRGGTLKAVGSSDVDHLSPTSAYVTGSMWLTRMFTRQLVTNPPSQDYETAISIVPDVAEAVPTQANGGISADGRTYTLRLRDGVRWNSAPPRAVTASDFVRGFKLFCNPVSPVGAPGYYTSTIAGMAEYCSRFVKAPATVAGIRQFVENNEITGVRAVDDKTLVITLRAPATDFLNLLALPFASAVPMEYLDYLPDGPEFRRNTLSNGPYAITRYVQNREIQLDRNPVWTAATDPNRPSYVDRVSIRLGIDDELAQLQIEAGTADLSFDLTMLTANLSSLRAIGDPRVNLMPISEHYGAMRYIVVNLLGSNNNAALRDPRVRQALALAVDKRAIAQLTGGPGISRPLNQAVASAVSGYRPGADLFVTPAGQGDPDAARRLLAAAGFPNGLKLRFAYSTNSNYPITAQSAQASLKRAGIDAQLYPYSSADLWGRLLANPQNARRGEWDIAMTAWYPDWYGANNGRSVIMPLFDGRQVASTTTNYGGYDNATVNAAIDRANAALRLEDAAAAWAEAVAQVTRDVAIVPLAEAKVGYMRSSRLRNCIWSTVGLQCDPTSVWLADAAPAAQARRP